MANAIYRKWKEQILQHGSNSSLAGTVKLMLVDLADYTFNADHDFLDDVPVAARVAISPALSSKTFTNGVFDAADTSFSSVTGDPCEAIIGFLDTGVESTSRLIFFQDTGVTGLPVTPNGGNINVAFDAAGIITI